MEDGNPGIFITKLIPGTPAEVDGCLQYVHVYACYTHSIVHVTCIVHVMFIVTNISIIILMAISFVGYTVMQCVTRNRCPM